METTNIESKQEKKVRFVVLFTLCIIMVEVCAGLLSKSMALLADAIHLGSHILILGVNWSAYILVRHLKNKHSDKYDSNKILSLSAFTSGIFLLATAVFIAVEAFERINENSGHITNHKFAIITAIAGLLANFICVYVMRDHEGEGDLNSRAVYLHLLSDILAKSGIIVGIVCALLWNILWIDAAVAIVSAIIAAHWAKNLLLDTGRSLTQKN